MEWYQYLIAFISFWLLRAIYYFFKVRDTNKYYKIYDNWIRTDESELIIGKHIFAIKKLFQDAGLKDFILSRIEPTGFGYTKSYNMKGFNNIHLNDPELINKILFKFEEAKGVYSYKMKQSFNPLFWVEFILKLPEQTFSYLNFDIADSKMKIIQLLYWIAMVIIGLHAGKVIDISSWF